ncbi:hypothetical protein EXS72_01760 [Candidatus Pacearchaeota archaeon]|nr:hypothetical protein [Candidatus Pacearchaeota archaeon]
MNLEITKGAIRNYLNTALADLSQQDSKTLEAARYMTLNDFSNLHRPVLLLATARGYSVGIERAMPIAAAIECVHVSSLIEDDMMDNSDTRRGKPACHKLFGESVAHLAHMLLREVAEENIIERNDLTNQQRIEIARLCYRTGKAMVYGQERDITQQSLDNVERIIHMYEGKSGALIGDALASGGIIGGACPEDILALERMGITAGVSYQIIDDAIDSRASIQETGKPVNQDVSKNTLVSLVGWDKVKKIKEEKDAEVDRLLKTLHGEHSLLGDMIYHLRGRHEKYMKT